MTDVRSTPAEAGLILAVREERPARVARLIEELVRSRAVRYVTSDPRDIQYLAGPPDLRGTLVLDIHGRSTLVAPAAAFDHDIAESCGLDVISVPLADNEGRVVAGLLAGTQGATVLGQLSDVVRRHLAVGVKAYVEAPDLGANLRRATSSVERSLVRVAVAVAEAGIRAAFKRLEAGVTELDLAAAAVNAMILEGGTSQWFEPCIGIGDRSGYPDARPTRRTVRSADVGFLDLGPIVGGYAGDITRSFAIGAPPVDAARAREATIALNERLAVELVPGAVARDLCAMATDVLAAIDRRWVMPHHLGHGLGVLGACPPWLRPDSDDVVLEHDLITLEPGIYSPGFWGIRHEDVYEVTSEGAIRVSTLPMGWFEPVRGWMRNRSAMAEDMPA
jgi:Xaa-Pro aminopeptidase